MTRPPISSRIASAFSLLTAPVLIMLGIDGMPSLSEIRASHTADIVGVWLLTWGLIAIGVTAALGVAWLAWTAQAETLRLEAECQPREAEFATAAVERYEAGRVVSVAATRRP